MVARRSGWGGARAGAGRPRTLRPPLKRRTIDLEAATDRKLVALSQDLGLSVSALILTAIADYLKRSGRRR
jgi:post-segregation antitoxin (ccd killing protein)